MTAFQAYALFGAPVLLLVAATAIVWLTGIQDSRPAQRHPAE